MQFLYMFFRVNETVIGATSNDVLFSLSSDEVSANCGNRMTRLAAHTLEQQSFAPMFPAPANSHQQVVFNVLTTNIQYFRIYIYIYIYIYSQILINL